MSQPICRALCCRSAAIKVVSQPIYRHCAATVQLFKWCRNLSAGTVLQSCSCLSGVETYQPALCCRGAAVQVVLKPICRDCFAEVKLFKGCRNLSASTVLQGCSCLSDAGTYLLALWCRGAGCLSSVGTYLLGTVLQGFRLFKRCRNLPPRQCGAVVQAV